MSTIEFKLPDIGEGVTEGEIVSWLVAAGDTVGRDQDMVEVMTDKATVTIGAPEAGVVKELRGQVGDTVPVGQVIVVLDTAASGAASSPAAASGAASGGSSETAPDGAGSSQAESSDAAGPKAASTPEPKTETKASAVGDIRDSLPGMASAAPAADQAHFDENPAAAPATRKLARELGVDIRRVPPSGESGRVTREDVQRFAERQKAGALATAGAAVPAAPGPSPVPSAQPVPAGAAEERIPLRGLRKRIYETMARSKHTAAHFTYVDECECSGLIALRGRLKAHAEAEGVKLTFLPFIVKAVVAALKKHPVMNTLIDDTTLEMVQRKTYDIGIAVATPAGLIVPVLRNADRLNIIEIARELERLASEAREGKSRREDLGGSSFTITSLGKLGGLLATPVVNYPEVGILFVPEMKKRPVVKGDEIVVGHVMDLSLSFDHRIIDGYDGAEFTQSVIELLQDPDRLMLAM